MKIIIVLLLLIKVAYLFEVNLTNDFNKGLIFNGTQYDSIKYPYVVTILTINKTTKRVMSCTGTLVKKLYVLTAAHCLYGYHQKNVKVFLGSILNKISQTAAELYIPDNYTSDEKDPIIFSDIGVIKLQKSFPNVKKFPKIGGHPNDFKNNKGLKCVCIGFGKINNNTNMLGDSGLMMTTTVKYGRTACKLPESDLIKLHWEEYLCSEPGQITMTCQGDSGGPMICNNKLYGVCSFGYNYKGEDDLCGGPDMQSVHTFVNFHLKWVNGIIDPGANRKKNSGNSLKPHLTLHISLAISLYSVLNIILK